MSPTSTQQWARRIRYADQNMRVSDAERQAVADSLGVHYSEGRLDQAEFDDRVSRAMAAKTRGDLDGLFDDLPDPEPTGASRKGNPGDQAVPYRRRRRGGFVRLLLLVVLAIVILSAIGHIFAAVTWFVPWFWIAVLAGVVLLVTRSSHHRHHDR